MRQPRAGDFTWARVPGGRASHIVTHDSWPRSVCGLDPPRWQEASWCPTFIFERRWRAHTWCVRLTPSHRRINFWPPDEE